MRKTGLRPSDVCYMGANFVPLNYASSVTLIKGEQPLEEFENTE